MPFIELNHYYVGAHEAHAFLSLLIFEPPVELNGVVSQILKAHGNATNFHHWRFLKKYP
jgi:hypothetical protein